MERSFEPLDVKRLQPGMMIRVEPAEVTARVLKITRGKKGRVNIVTSWRSLTVRDTGKVLVLC